MSKTSVHQRKARDYIQREDWGNALSELQRMLAAEGENPTLHNQIGDVYLRKDDVTSACQHFERAIDLYAEVGLHNNAIALCKKIMRLRPGRVEIRYRLARLRLDQGFRTEAAVFFADYLEHAPTEGDSVDTLESHCREMIDLMPDEAPVGKILEKLELAQRFAAAFDLVRKLAQRAADAGDDAAAGRYAEKMRSLRILVERSGGRDLLAGVPDPSPPAPAAPAAAVVEVAAEPPLDLGDAAASLFTAESAPSSADLAAGMFEGVVPDPMASMLEPNVLPADFGVQSRSALLLPEAETAFPAEVDGVAIGSDAAEPATGGGEFQLVELPGFEPEGESSPATHAAATPEPAAAALDPFALDPLALEPEPPVQQVPTYELPETNFDELVRDLGADIVAPEFAAAPAAEPLPAAPAAEADAVPAPDGIPPLLDPAAEGALQPPGGPRALRDIPVWIPEGETALSHAGPPPDAVPQLDLESVIDSFREQMARALDGDGAARYDLGVAYFEMGLYNEALAEFEAAARCPGLEVQSYEMLAACLLATGRHGEVVELLVPVLAADGHAPRGRLGLQYSLGLAYESLGETDQARRCFEEVALVDIEFKDVQARLQRL